MNAWENRIEKELTELKLTLKEYIYPCIKFLLNQFEYTDVQDACIDAILERNEKRFPFWWK